MSKIYILQQELSGLEKGTEFKQLKTGVYEGLICGGGIIISSSIVENYPDWFLPKEDKKKPIIYPNVHKVIKDMQPLLNKPPDHLQPFHYDMKRYDEQLAKIIEIAKKATQTMKKEPKKENVTLEDCYKAIELSKVRSEITLNPGSNKSDVEFQTHNLPLSCLERGNQLIAICALMAVADLVNYESHWKPEYEEFRYTFSYKQKANAIEIMGSQYFINCIYFKTRKGAEEAILILGTETIKTALGL